VNPRRKNCSFLFSEQFFYCGGNYNLYTQFIPEEKAFENTWLVARNLKTANAFVPGSHVYLPASELI